MDASAPRLRCRRSHVHRAVPFVPMTMLPWFTHEAPLCTRTVPLPLTCSPSETLFAPVSREIAVAPLRIVMSAAPEPPT